MNPPHQNAEKSNKPRPRLKRPRASVHTPLDVPKPSAAHEEAAALPGAEVSVVDLVQSLRSGDVASGALSVDNRRRCVHYLGVEGLSVPEIAQLIGCSDRTITRDRAHLQDKAMLRPDPQLPGRFAGRLASEAEACLSRIRRVTRDRETPPAVKVEGERACFEVLCKLGEQLQRLGFLPNYGGQVQVDLHHSGEAIPSYEELEEEIRRLEKANEGGDSDPAVAGHLVKLNTQLHRARLAQGVSRLAK